MADLSFIVFADHEEAADALARSLTDSGHAVVLETVCDEEDLRKQVEKQRPDAVFLDLGYAPDVVLDMAERLPAPRPHLIVSGPEDQSGVILRALKQGAKEFLPSNPEPQQIAAAVQRVLMLAPDSSKRERGKVIAVLGTKGGVGATFLTCQLAASLQATGGRSVVVDLNTPLGDVAISFDIRPSYTFADIASGSEDVDAAMVERVLQSHPCGARILAAPTRIEEAELVKDSHVRSVFEILRGRADWVIVDVSRSWNEASIQALELADEIVLVALQDVPTLNHVRTYRDLLLRLGISKHRLRTVINRHTTGADVSDGEVASFLGVPVDATLPNDYANALACVNEGRTLRDLAGTSKLCQGFEDLAVAAHGWVGRELVNGGEQSEGKIGNRIRGLFRRKSNGAA